MNNTSHISLLKAKIKHDLTPLVDRDYRYLMMTEHGNIGDTLIFQGECDFLRTIPHRCKEWTTISSFGRRFPIIPNNDLLIMRGSGSFGDLWPTAPTFWREVLQRYPHNPVLFMPQSVHFDDQNKLEEMVRVCRRPGRTIICLRDRQSFDFVSRHFDNEIYLVPDMAFYIDIERWRSRRVEECARRLLIFRNDKEACENSVLANILTSDDVDVSDWPTMKLEHQIERKMAWIRGRSAGRYTRFYDFIVRHFYRPALVRTGFRFIEPYNEVYAMRMHGGVLALLLGKKTTFFDNSYGKVRSLYETWLADCEDVNLVIGK